MNLKAARKMLKKLTIRVNFTKILCPPFMSAYPKSAKNTFKPSVFFVLLGPGRVIASCKIFVKLTLGVQFLPDYLRTEMDRPSVGPSGLLVGINLLFISVQMLWLHAFDQVSISSMFYAHVFCTKFWRQNKKALFRVWNYKKAVKKWLS